MDVGDPMSGRPLPRRPHVCFVSSTIYPVLVKTNNSIFGGAQVQQAIVARALRARGYRVSVLTSDHGVPDSVTPEGIEIRHTPPTGRRGIRGLRRIYPRMTDVVNRLREIDPDVAYFRGAGGVLAACVWFARRGGKKVVFASASDADFLAGRIFGLERHELALYRLGLRWCDVIAVQNRAQDALLRDRYGRRGAVVPNCYAETPVRIGDASGPVLWVGQIDRNKRPELFIQLATRHPSRQFVIVGGARQGDPATVEYCRSIEEQARRLRNISFVGFVPYHEVGRHYDGASALVNTSVTEGFPNTFLQSWIRGVPTLSFVAPTVSDEPTGTIVCSDVAELDARLAVLLHDPEQWRVASQRVRQHFGTYHSVDAVMPYYERLFE